MKLAILGVIAMAATAFTQQRGPVQTSPDPIKVRGCLQGNGSTENPWSMKGVVLPSPPIAVPAGNPGGRGDGGARGGGANPGAGAAGGRGQAGAGRGGDAGRGAPPAPPVAA